MFELSNKNYGLTSEKSEKNLNLLISSVLFFYLKILILKIPKNVHIVSKIRANVFYVQYLLVNK